MSEILPQVASGGAVVAVLWVLMQRAQLRIDECQQTLGENRVQIAVLENQLTRACKDIDALGGKIRTLEARCSEDAPRT